MSVLNKYKRWVPMLIPINDEYWDFVLSQDGTPSIGMGPRLNERCLAAYIAFWDPECQELNGVRSYSKYYWEKWKNSGVKLENIGYTGVDNGLIYYGGFANVSNKEFFDIFTKSVLEIPAGDNNLHLKRVTGNTGVYVYDMNYVDGQYWSLKGGFFQGFYKLFGHDYQVLPQYIEDEWNVEITLRPMGYPTDDKTLNNTHPGNEGIFFYMGTRAEDKFLEMYNCDITEYPDRDQPTRHALTCDYFLDKMYEYAEKTTCQYFDDDYASGNEEKPSDYYADDYANSAATEYCNGAYYGGENGTPCDKKEEPEPEKPKEKEKEKKPNPYYSNTKKAKYLAYFLNYYGYKEYSSCGCDLKGRKVEPLPAPKPDSGTDVCEISYIATGDPYYESEIILSGLTLTTKDGKSLSDTGYYEIKTDNKFLTFNRTKYGFTTANWDEDAEILLTGTTEEFRTGNLFLLMHRGKSGYTTCTIDSYFRNNRKPYDFKKSLKGNAFAVKYNCDGSISYRYLVKDCDAPERFSVLEETSFPGIIKPEEWSTVTIKFNILNGGGGVDDCGRPYIERKMKVRIYVNGYLKFVSKELPEFDFKELSTISEKQEGVPFNISVGGGTQGLCDSVWLDYNRAFEKILPIEKYFAGTFIGDIYDFRFYTCASQRTEILNNYLFTKTQMSERKVFI